MQKFIGIIIFFIASTTPCAANESCNSKADILYEQFKEYRENINTASRLEDLTGYFSINFNQYFSNKLASASGESSRQRYLTQYWDNLNTVKDIVIVFDYSVQCNKGNVSLALVSILNAAKATEGQKIELWNVKINYINDNLGWKIDSFEYEKLDPRKNYIATEIKNNFVLIR